MPVKNTQAGARTIGELTKPPWEWFGFLPSTVERHTHTGGLQWDPQEETGSAMGPDQAQIKGPLGPTQQNLNIRLERLKSDPK